MTENDIRKRLRAEADKLGSRQLLARQMGITPAYLSDFLAGNRGAGKAILAYLGVEKLVTYRSSK